MVLINLVVLVLMFVLAALAGAPTWLLLVMIAGACVTALLVRAFHRKQEHAHHRLMAGVARELGAEFQDGLVRFNFQEHRIDARLYSVTLKDPPRLTLTLRLPRPLRLAVLVHSRSLFNWSYRWLPATEEVRTGDARFDSAFVAKSSDPAATGSFLTAKVRSTLFDLCALEENSPVDVYTDAQGFHVRILVAPREPEGIARFISLAMRMVKFYLRASRHPTRELADSCRQTHTG